MSTNNAPASAPENVEPVVATPEVSQEEYEGNRIESVADSIGEERVLEENIQASQPTDPTDRPFANPADIPTETPETTEAVAEQIGKTYEQALANNDQATIDKMDALLKTMPVETVAADAASYETYVKQGGQKEAPKYFEELKAAEVARVAELTKAAEQEAATNGGKVSMETQMSLMEARLQPLLKIFETFFSKIKNLISKLKGETVEEPESAGAAAAEKLQDDFEQDVAEKEQIENEAQFNEELVSMASSEKWAEVKIKGHVPNEANNLKLLKDNFKYPADKAALTNFEALLNAPSAEKKGKLLRAGFTMDQALELQSHLNVIEFQETTDSINYSPKNSETSFSFGYDQGAELLKAVKENADVRSLKIDKILASSDFSEIEKDRISTVLTNRMAQKSNWVKFTGDRVLLNPNGKIFRGNDVRLSFPIDSPGEGFMPRILNIYNDLKKDNLV